MRKGTKYLQVSGSKMNEQMMKARCEIDILESLDFDEMIAMRKIYRAKIRFYSKLCGEMAKIEAEEIQANVNGEDHDQKRQEDAVDKHLYAEDMVLRYDTMLDALNKKIAENINTLLNN